MKKVLLAMMIALCLTGVTKAQTIVVTGATIIDGNGGTPIRDGVIVINDKRIAAVGSKSSVNVPPGAQEIRVRRLGAARRVGCRRCGCARRRCRRHRLT